MQITSEQFQELIESGVRCIYATPSQIFLGRRGARFRATNPDLVGIWCLDFGGMWAQFRRETHDREHGSTFGVADLSYLFRYTPQAIQKWLREGVIKATVQPPSGHGRHIEFSMVDAFAAMLVASMRRQGRHTLDLCKRVANAISSLTPEDAQQVMGDDAQGKIEVEAVAAGSDE